MVSAPPRSNGAGCRVHRWWLSRRRLRRLCAGAATAGAIGGPIVGLDLRTLYLKDLTLHGCTIPPPALFAKLVAAIASGALRPLIAARWPLQRLADAQEAFLRKAHLGKIVLDI